MNPLMKLALVVIVVTDLFLVWYVRRHERKRFDLSHWQFNPDWPRG